MNSSFSAMFQSSSSTTAPQNSDSKGLVVMNMMDCQTFQDDHNIIYTTHHHQDIDEANTKEHAKVAGQEKNASVSASSAGGGENKKCKKHRYAFQTRSQVDILDDGYRWRKYGQKAVKNNKFPRSYYRCTYQGCSVKKQIQRLSKDESIVVTTYEGMHSHAIEKSTDNFEHILTQMQIYNSF